MSLTKTAIERNRVTLMVLTVIFFAGIQAFFSLPRAEDPDFIIRVAQVITYFSGASPERVEQLVTDKLEKAIQEMPELDFVQSESKTGVSILIVSILERYEDMRPIWDKLRRKIEDARTELPEDVRGPFVNDEFGDVFGTIVTLTGEGYSYAELEDIAEDVRDEVLLIPEVAKVEIYGAQEERIFVEYNNARLAELGVSPFQLQQLLASQNIIFPGGDVRTSHEEIVLEPSGNFESVEELRSTVIRLPGREDLMYLGDLANVSRGYIDPPRTKTHASGTEGLALAVSLREGGNITVLGEKIEALISDLQAQFPYGITFDFAALQSFHVNRKVDDFVGNLFQAILLVLVVMLVSLGLRTGFVVAALVPMAMIMALLIMSFLGIGLDQMSLAALIISLGMLVDNAIVMSESIMVQMAAGKTPVDAALESARELQVPLLTSSATTVAAFLPIYLAESATGEYVAPLFKLVAITLFSSWVLALTMTPLLCVKFLRVKASPEKDGFDSRFYRIYRRLLLLGLRHRVAASALVVIAFVTAIQGLGLVPNIFFPPNDKAILTAELSLPVGSPVARTEAVVDELEAYMHNELSVVGDGREEGIVNWASFIGEGAPRFVLTFNPEPPKPEYAILIVNATSQEAILNEIIPRMEQFCFEQFPDLRASISLLPLGPSAAAPVEVRVSGRVRGRGLRPRGSGEGRAGNDQRSQEHPRQLTPLREPNTVNERWSMDFVSDQLANSLRFRTLNVVDDCSREALAIEVARALPGSAVVVALEAVAEVRGYPAQIVPEPSDEPTKPLFESHFGAPPQLVPRARRVCDPRRRVPASARHRAPLWLVRDLKDVARDGYRVGQCDLLAGPDVVDRAWLDVCPCGRGQVGLDDVLREYEVARDIRVDERRESSSEALHCERWDQANRLFERTEDGVEAERRNMSAVAFGGIAAIERL